MRFLPPDEQIDLYETGFPEEDLLGRKKISERLSELLERIEDPLVIALDGGWGTGKSYFLKRWVAEHRKVDSNKALTVYFDAFAHDYLNEPLIGLISALSARTPTKNNKNITALKSAAVKLIRPAVRVTLAAVSGGATEMLGGAMAGATSAATSEAKDAVDKFWKREEGRHQAMLDFHSALENLTSPSKEGNSHTPLVIVIDELDRCRPDYALEVLEIIKHFFSVPHVHFVLGVNLYSLENSVKARYGPQIDATAYLQKFVSLKMALPDHHENTNTTLLYLKHYGQKMGLNDRLLDDLFHQTKVLLRRNSISIRDAGKILSTASLLPEGLAKENNSHLRKIATTLLITKIIHPSLFMELVNSSILKNDLDEYLGIEKKYLREQLSTGEFNSEYDSNLLVLNSIWHYILSGGKTLQNDYASGIARAFNQHPQNCAAMQVPQWVNENILNVFKLT